MSGSCSLWVLLIKREARLTGWSCSWDVNLGFDTAWQLLVWCTTTQVGCACVLSCVWLFVTPQTVAHQAPLSVGFSGQEYWSGLPFPPPGDLPNPGIEPMSLVSPAMAGRFFTTAPRGKPLLGEDGSYHAHGWKQSSRKGWLSRVCDFHLHRERCLSNLYTLPFFSQQQQQHLCLTETSLCDLKSPVSADSVSMKQRYWGKAGDCSIAQLSFWKRSQSTEPSSTIGRKRPFL